MNLTAQAEADLSFTMEDVDNGFGVALQFRDSNGDFQTVNCQSTDIGYLVDPNTGQAVVGRTVEANGRISTFNSLNISVPKRSDSGIVFVTTAGDEVSLKVMDNYIDRKMGIYKLTMEAVKVG